MKKTSDEHLASVNGADKGNKKNEESHETEGFRPGLEIRMLRNMIYRYLSATQPAEAESATGGNTPILMYLAKHQSDDIFQHDIESRFGIARSTASRVLSLMEKKGLVERQAVEHDARLRRISLTKKAVPITSALHKNGAQMERILLNGISPADQEKLFNLITIMKNNLLATGKLGKGYYSGPGISRNVEPPKSVKGIESSEATPAPAASQPREEEQSTK